MVLYDSQLYRCKSTSVIIFILPFVAESLETSMDEAPKKHYFNIKHSDTKHKQKKSLTKKKKVLGALRRMGMGLLGLLIDVSLRPFSPLSKNRIES